ncbi:MAG: type II secretion system protein GspM [Pseudomonadota bacterium]
MKDWFDGLAVRERAMVAFGAVFVVVAVFYALVWSPLSISNERLASDIESDRKTLAELRRVEGRLTPPNGGARSNPSGQSLAILISQSVTRFQLRDSLVRNNPSADDNTVTVRFENAAFDNLVAWLADLERTSGLGVRSSSFNRTESSGRIDATVTLERL